MGRPKKDKPVVLSPDRDKQKRSIEALKLIGDKDVHDPDFLTGGSKYLYMVVPGLTIKEISDETGLDEDEIYSLTIYKYSTKLRNEITIRADDARNKRLD